MKNKDNIKDDRSSRPEETIAREVSRFLATKLKSAFDLPRGEGFCWIGLEKPLTTLRLDLSSATKPVRVPVRVLLVMFVGPYRFELKGSVVMNFRPGDSMEFTLSDPAFTIHAAERKLQTEDALQTLAIELREESAPDSHLYICVSIDQQQYGVDGWLSSGEAKAYRSMLSQLAAAA